MKKIFLGLIALLVVLPVTVMPANAITWGEPDTAHSNVGAMVVDWPGYGPWQFCSGTLVHPKIFMTAGHCTYDLEELGIEQVWVNFDLYALTAETLRPVAQVITHPDFAFVGNNFHDVALLILEEPVTDIQPAKLPAQGYLDTLKKDGLLRQGPTGAKFTVVGYGGLLNWPPPEIYYEDFREVAISEYVALVKTQLHVSQNILKDDGGTCFGDSGGPIFYTEPDGTEVVVGITSWGDAMCVATGFYYRVDIPDTLNLIQEAIEGLE